MFNIGMLELVVVLLVAFLVVGPKDLPKVARWVAKQVKSLRKLVREIKKETGWDEFAREFKDTADDLKKDVDAVKKTFQEADISSDLNSAVEDVKQSVQSVRQEAENAAKDIRSELEGKA